LPNIFTKPITVGQAGGHTHPTITTIINVGETQELDRVVATQPSRKWIIDIATGDGYELSLEILAKSLSPEPEWVRYAMVGHDHRDGVNWKFVYNLFLTLEAGFMILKVENLYTETLVIRSTGIL
jgi:hypothetical protein